MTPLEILSMYRQTLGEDYQKWSYVGRLDPMAHGVMVLMGGDDLVNREEVKSLPKTYEFEVLLSVGSDSGDVLGLVEAGNLNGQVTEPEIKDWFEGLVGKRQQVVPAYSAVRVGGKALFEWAREGRIDEVVLPRREVEIYASEYGGMKKVTKEEIWGQVQTRVNKVSGDFRQEEVVESWKKGLGNLSDELTIVSGTVECSSGTYVRSLSEELGEKLGCGTLTWEILRTRVGDYKLSESLKVVDG